jgi:hypothetical protein
MAAIIAAKSTFRHGLFQHPRLFTSVTVQLNDPQAFLGLILEVCTRFEPLIGEHVLSEFIGQHDVLVFLVHF